MRDREELFSEATLETIAQAAAASPGADAMSARLEALKHCLTQLSPDDRALLEWKYAERRKLTDLALQQSRSADSFHQKLPRLRLALRTCITRNLKDLS